jgi:hypothetical protein
MPLKTFWDPNKGFCICALDLILTSRPCIPCSTCFWSLPQSPLSLEPRAHETGRKGERILFSNLVRPKLEYFLYILFENQTIPFKTHLSLHILSWRTKSRMLALLAFLSQSHKFTPSVFCLPCSASASSATCPSVVEHRSPVFWTWTMQSSCLFLGNNSLLATLQVSVHQNQDHLVGVCVTESAHFWF